MARLRVIHTSDWHLGHSLFDYPRTYEHRAFLSWLIGLIEAEAADALLVAGDVFDAANPPTSALDDWYGFLAEARRRFPRLAVVVVGGNHDSPARLDVTNPLLAKFGVHVVGGLPLSENGELDVGRLVVPLADSSGEPAAWCVAMPFLRPADLPPGDDDAKNALVEGVRRRYADAICAARRRRRAGQALVAMGHCYMTGTRLSELSERRILGGNQHALPADIFPDDVAYAALGHLHLAQAIGGREHVRYCGSPIPLSFAEASYPHQVCVVDLAGEGAARVRAVRVPRSVDVRRLPADGPASLEDVKSLLRALPSRQGPEEDPTRPLMEVRVRCDRPEPRLRLEIEAAIEGKRPRLLRISQEAGGDGHALADAAPGATLLDVTPEEVLQRCWARQHEGTPPPEMLAAFAELRDWVERGEVER